LGTLSLTDPVNGTTADATLIATNNAAIKTVVNGGIEDVNIAADAALSVAKLAAYPADATKVLHGDGTWSVLPSTELSYVEFTAPVTISATSEGTATQIVAAAPVLFDGATRVKIEMFAPRSDPGVNAEIDYVLWDSVAAASVGRLGDSAMTAPSTAQVFQPISFTRFLTPSSATHTYSWRAFRATANGTVQAGAGGAGAFVPGFIRITKA
jgi:hypothetical protein